MSQDKKPRQWIIKQSKYDVHGGLYTPSDDKWLNEQIKMDSWEKIPAIELSAYEELQTELDQEKFNSIISASEMGKLKRELRQAKADANFYRSKLFEIEEQLPKPLEATRIGEIVISALNEGDWE